MLEGYLQVAFLAGALKTKINQSTPFVNLELYSRPVDPREIGIEALRQCRIMWVPQDLMDSTIVNHVILLVKRGQKKSKKMFTE